MNSEHLMTSNLEGRNGVVFGVANKRSIAWSIAQGLHAAGMKLAVTYQNERLEQEAKDLILGLLLEAFVLVGHRQLHSGGMQALGDRPGDRAFVRDSKDDTIAAFEVRCH